MTIKTWQERMAADVQGLDKCVHMGNEIAELRVELEQAKKDAGRYRWLREQIYLDEEKRLRIARTYLIANQEKTLQERLDEAIDAAIAKEQV